MVAHSNFAAARPSSAVRWYGVASLGLLYDDNILANSPGYEDDFITGRFPGKFITKTTEDLIVAPAVEITARKRLLSWGSSRFRFKIKRWNYTKNPIKTSTDFHFYLRQYVRRRQSIELYYQFSPERYIRQLRDDPPSNTPGVPGAWTPFRVARQVWQLAWRQPLRKNINAKILLENNNRTYSRPFRSNNINAWEVRGRVKWRKNRRLTWRADYSYEIAAAEGITGESDPSYNRHLLRLGLDLKPKRIAKIVDRLNVSSLFMVYNYTTDLPSAVDPFHAGRTDRFYKLTVTAEHKLSRPLTIEIAVRRTQRVSSAPWRGNISRHKNYQQWVIWSGIEYRF